LILFFLRHRGHVGWDPEKGFDLNNLDPDLVKVFIQAGINEFHLKDKETSKMIYNVLENKGEINAAQKDAKQKGKENLCTDKYC
uniref:CRIB domain-containing protein n=1 Tax=Callorhinchus milii TaxID=7868 RepID=A0A4W3JZM0_CALMI